MKRIVSIIGGLFTLLGGFQIYLNLTNKEIISFEQTIKIVKLNFENQPIKSSLQILFIIFISLIVTVIIDKLLNYVIYREKKRKIQINSSIVDHEKRKKNKVELFAKIIDNGVTYNDCKNKPWIKINAKYHNIIIRDINDTFYPDIKGKWLKMETFDMKNDGIEFIGNLSTIVYFDKNHNWDVFLYDDKIKKGKYFKANNPESIYLLAYEDILHIDWEIDEYNSSITIYTSFKYKKHSSPFKEVRYYVEGGIEGNSFFTLLKNDKRRNFKPFFWLYVHKLMLRLDYIFKKG